MLGIEFGSEAFVDARWLSFKESNPFPEYTEAAPSGIEQALNAATGATARRFYSQ